MRKMHYFILIAILLFSAVVYRTYEQYTTMEKTRQNMLSEKGESLSAFMVAFRETYQHAFAEHHIPVTDDTLHLLPVKTSRALAKTLSDRLHGKVEIRSVSDRPRNPANQANPFEKKMIDYFQAHPQVHEKIIQKDNMFYYLRPLIITSKCLRCHGKREAAPPIVRKRYTLAYDYKIGDVRGLSSIRIAKTGVADKLFSDFVLSTAVTSFLYFLLLMALYALINRMNKMEREHARDLEEEVEQATRRIEKQKEVFETLFEKSSDGIFILRQQRIIQCNERIIDMLQYESKADLIGQRPAELSPETQPDGQDSREKGDTMVELAMRTGRHQFEWEHRRKDGTPLMVDVTITPITLEGHRVLHVVWRDISDKKRAEAQLIQQQNALHHQAHHDALTHLPNRSLLLDRLEQATQRARRNGTIVAVFFIDLDNFKKINDSLGHHIGDQVLIRVARRLGSVIRQEDTLARLGGDEFTIVAEAANDTHFSSRLAESILEQFREPVLIEGHTLHLSTSIGISFYPQDAQNVNDVLKYADAAMYRAKTDGKNMYRYYSPEMTQRLLARVQLEEEIRHAMKHHEFTVYYQPQMDAEAGRITGLEALIRWNHPQRGLVLPDAFIPLAEETGLIIEIDRWVMRTAMRQMRTWRDAGIDPGVLSLNLSVKQLMSDTFIPVLKEMIRETGVDPKWLELEVTEREMMVKPEHAIQRLNELSAMGISIAVDDFGTGYSSLAYLKQLPVDKLKIDRSFVRGVVDNQDDASITCAVIALAQSLKLRVIAEGAETDAQVQFLIQNGCPHIQGYYFGKPMSAQGLEKRLAG